MQKKLNAIFVRLCLIRDLSQMCPCVVPLPAVVVRVYMPCVSLTLAGSCWGYSCDAVMCAELGRYSTFPFGRRWPSTLKARDCLSSPARSSQCKRTDIDRETHISQSICFTFCVWVCVWGQVRFHPGKVGHTFIFFSCRLYCSVTSDVTENMKEQRVRPISWLTRRVKVVKLWNKNLCLYASFN